MTQQVEDPATRRDARWCQVEALAKLADLCVEGLPVPASTYVSSGPSGVWLTLHVRDGSDVDAWAGQLGASPRLDEYVHVTDHRKWQNYGVEVWHEDAKVRWSPGVTRVYVRAAVPAE